MCSKNGTVSEGSPNVVDLIRAGKVDLIINTPEARQGCRDGYEIRRAARRFLCTVHHNDSGSGRGSGCGCGGCREGGGRRRGRGGAGVSWEVTWTI